MNLTNTSAKQDKKAVIAIFRNQESLDKTLSELKARNFKKENISILTAKHKDLNNIDYNLMSRDIATTGLMYGLATGGILGWLGPWRNNWKHKWCPHWFGHLKN